MPLAPGLRKGGSLGERAEMIEFIRGEIIGPARRLTKPRVAEIKNGEFRDTEPTRRGPLAWQPDPEGELEEILFYERESPHRKYGAGLLHPGARVGPEKPAGQPANLALHSADTIGADPDSTESGEEDEPAAKMADDHDADADITGTDTSDDFEVSSPDIYQPSTVGISLGYCQMLWMKAIRRPIF